MFSLGVLLLLQMAKSSWALNDDCAMNCARGVSSGVCPDYVNQQFQFDISNLHEESSLKIECNFGFRDEVDFSFMKNCSFPNIGWVEIKYCPFTNKSFGDLLEGFGVIPERISSLSVYHPSISSGELTEKHFDRLSNLTYLNLETTKLTVASENSFENVSLLETLHIRGNNLDTLPRALFTPLKKLKLLNLSHNNISSLPVGGLNGLDHLEFLYFWSNRIERIPPNFLSQLPSLKNISFLINNLQELDAELFSSNQMLQHVDVRRNSLQFVPDTIFLDNLNLDVVKMAKNNISSISENLFKYNTKLRIIDLSQNSLSDITSNSFRNLPDLETLDISRNTILDLPADLLSSNPKLEHLYLDNNQLSSLASNQFESQKKLIKIDLSHNNMTDLPDDLFSSCFLLKNIKLNHNNLTHISYTSFPRHFSTSSLECIDLSYNKLNSENITTYFTFALNQQLKLECLNLDYNEFQLFPDNAGFYIFNHLKKLSFRGNSISYLDLSSISGLRNDTVVDLRDNSISSVSSVAIALTSTSTVSVRLSGNPLKCDCNLHKFVKMLRHQKADNNPIFGHFTPNSISGVSPSDYDVYQVVTSAPTLRVGINVLDSSTLKCHEPEQLVNQSISSIPLHELLCKFPDHNCTVPCQCYYRPDDNMVLVNCSSYDLEEAPRIPQSSKFNYTLDLSSNYLQTFNLSGLNIINLILERNSLSNHGLNRRKLLPKFLKLLNLRHNNLTTLPETFLKALSRTGAVVDLDNNPWKCNCEIRHLHNFVQANPFKVNLLRHVLCNSSGRALVDLTEEDICPVLLRPMVIVTIAVIGVLLLLFVILVTASFYHYKDILKPFLWKHRICMWWINEEELDVDKEYDAFISYSHKDEEFINRYLVPGLENGHPKYRVCLHYRDWMVGVEIQKQIIDSVRNSRRTLLVLSKNFIESVWGQMEFRVAYQQALKDETSRVIVIVYGEMPPRASLDPELCHYIQTNTYLEYSQANTTRFWERLRYAMPHLPTGKKKRVSDRLEMVKGKGNY